MVLATYATSSSETTDAVPELIPSHRFTILEGLAWIKVVAAWITASVWLSVFAGTDCVVSMRSNRLTAWISLDTEDESSSFGVDILERACDGIQMEDGFVSETNVVFW